MPLDLFMHPGPSPALGHYLIQLVHGVLREKAWPQKEGTARIRARGAQLVLVSG